jgi:predicted amidohydrolase YtcJ
LAVCAGSPSVHAMQPAGSNTNTNSNRSAELADFALTRGVIYTADGARRTVQALAVREGKIIFAGSDAEVARYIGPKTKVKNAGGKLVLPGLIDAHIHPGGIVDFGGCSLQAKPKTLAEIAATVRGCIEKQRIPTGHWVSVSGWEFAAGNQTDARHATLRAALDAASTQHPIVMTGWDFHHGAFNSVALARAKNARGEVVGYSKKTLETDFAQYKAVVGLDASGEPSGDIQDDGRDPIDTSEVAREEFEKLLRQPEKLAQRLNSAGITAVQDALASSAGGPGGGSIYDVYDALIRKDQLTFRLNVAQFWEPEAFRDAASWRIDWDKLFGQANEVRQKYAANPLIRADVVKIFGDGAMEANPNNVPPTFGASIRPVPYLQPIFGKDANGDLLVKGYVDVASPECAYVRARPMEYSTPMQIADYVESHGYHPGQCAISYGIPTHAPALFREYVKRSHLAGYTLHIHTNGDGAVKMAIEAIEAARAADGISTQPDTLAHIQCAAPEDVLRIGKNRLYAALTYSWMYAEPKGYDLSVIPFFHKVSGNGYEALHDPNGYYARCVFPAKALKDAGVVLAAGSDAPVLTKDPQPFVNMEIGVTRARHGLPPISPWQRLNIRDLVDAYTINNAHALNRAAEIGSLEAGKSADFIIVDQNILALGDQGRPEKIGATKVLETWFMGRKVYPAAR